MKTETAGVVHCLTPNACISPSPSTIATKRPAIFSLLLIVMAIAVLVLPASAMVFTENTEIGPLNNNYDGQDIVILDCTVTMDGPHTFSSLVLAANGILTHSGSANGQLPLVLTVTNAPYILSGTLPDLLTNSNILSSPVLTDTNGDVYSNGVDYLTQEDTNAVYYISRTTNSSIPDGGTVLVSYNYSGSVPAGLNLTVTGVVWVTSGCEIDADGIGYGSGFGPGAGSRSANTFFDASGGGYGGSGGMSQSNAVGGVCYDSLYQPSSLGSGGGASYAGNGGSGGGLVQIKASDEVEIDGVISANGDSATNSRAGGGAGGGIWISAPTFSGTGSLSVNGGAGAPGYGGGGGGGRIAIVCGTNNFAGTMTSYGGGGVTYGGAGTLFTELSGSPGLLALNNNGNPGARSTVTLPNLADLAISNGAAVAVSGAFQPQNLTVGTNGVLTGVQQTSLQFSVSNLTVAAGATMSVNGLGYLNGGTGSGGNYTIGNVTYGGGGGHGGYGAAAAVTNATGGTSSDSQSDPTGFGGGGGSLAGGAGGGAININATGALQINGVVSANGLNGAGIAGGGGAGGSIYISAPAVSGNGAITANGGTGASSLGGGGGGGRIAIVAGAYNFIGAVNCFGGGGANVGGAGTLLLSQTGAPAWQDLVMDNGGNTGPFTSLQSAYNANLFVQDGASATLPTSSTFSSLLVTSNAWITFPAATIPSSVTVTSNATLQAGGGLTLNADGISGNGYGLGQATSIFPYAAGGGGNGGAGGNGGTNASAGGAGGFNSYIEPTYGGGNGGGYSPYSIGGLGGGALRMTVNGTLQVNGTITANGGNGSGAGGGGGAGGSLMFSVGTLAGSGLISANGGNGVDSMGGGGGGGIINLTFSSNSFSGTISALGGAGANGGGAGIVYFKTNSLPYGQIIVDNGGQTGADSVILSPGATTSLIVRNNSTLYYASQSSLTFGNVLITNASLVVSNYPFTINANNIFVQNGGRISANGAGYPANSGPGAGRFSLQLPYYAGGGGGNGGSGGSAISNSVTGGAGGYEPYSDPFEAGSGGGGYASYSIGGAGGGVLELNVSGTLAVNGTISANGGNGSGIGGGGGAGGSLYLNVGSLSGSGLISANGGNGVNNTGGGGGGGMVGIFYQTSLASNFTGVVSAYGGLGATDGGAGTVFVKTNSTSQGTLYVDNGGNRGTNTPITTSSSVNALVVRNGAMASIPSQATFASLLVTSNAWLVPSSLQSGQIGQILLNLIGNATIQAGGGIIADSLGYLQNTGTGHGSSQLVSPTYPCSGAGHGGAGAFGLSNLVAGGGTYDSILEPETAGSGGGGYAPYSPGGAGGGIINISALSGALQLNGLISANGGNGSGLGGGGGSGGAIYLSASTITGTGSITANGGNGALNGGGGGGGCISLHSTAEVRSNIFLGTISAYGGGGANYGGAGTLYYVTNNSIGIGTPELYLDNNNNVGTNTTLSIGGPNVVIQNGAIGAIPTTTWLPGSVMVLSNSELVSLVSQTTIRGNLMTIAAGGVLSVDGVGYSAQNGPGAGSTTGGISGGGGHGGYGGGNTGPANLSGLAYDSIQLPTLPGSGGANAYAQSGGGAGGGALDLSVNGLTVNGTISANGRPGGLDAGGGAGGSIYISGMKSGISGTGIISANGGAATGTGGGGAGGRISVLASPLFTGQFTASGGEGSSPGGAGTIFTSASGGQTLLINNGGLAGASTPLSPALSVPSTPFELDVSGSASVLPLSPLPLLSNLNVTAASTLTIPFAQSNLFIGVMGNASIAGDLDVDYLGYSQLAGPGAGSTVDSQGSGGGSGGSGGASDSGAPGGKTYGSASAPLAFGSGGGYGAKTTTGGSAGGGALRLSVSGALTVNGNVSANGDSGLQDDSGGGSGGSVWITAQSLSGSGTISAFGGDGVFYGGGGGGGGRIAIYAPTNQFTGTTNVSGGMGATPGQPGTVSLSTTLNGLQVISQSPTGLVMNTVSSVNLTFSDMLNAGSVSSSVFTLVTPAGPLDKTNVNVTVTGPYSLQLSFPVQSLVGTYTVQVPATVADMFGQSLAQPYAGTFTVSLPTISGTVTDTNGAGLAGVSIQPSGGLAAVLTDTNGNYSLGVPPGWTGTVTPLFDSHFFVPSLMNYTNVTGSLTNQNYSIFQTIAPTLTTTLSAGNCSLNWNGISGVTYQVLWSTNLITWQPLGSPITGTNGPMQLLMPSGSNAAEFFQIQAGD